MLNLSTVLCSIQNALTVAGWQSVIEDDYPDLKLLVCENQSGPLEAFTRLDVLVMTPEFNPTDASGVCLCFLFYADPSKVVDMRKLGLKIRKNDFWVLRQEIGEIFLNSKFSLQLPSISIKTRPKNEHIKFDSDNVVLPAFFVEFDYWIPNFIINSCPAPSITPDSVTLHQYSLCLTCQIRHIKILSS